MSDAEMIEKYKQIDYILHLDYGWLWQDILRYIGSGIVFSLMWLNNAIETIVDKSISLNDFYSTGPMKEFMDVSRPIIWGLFLIALLVLGFQFMLNKIDKRNEVVLNVILAVCVIVVIPDLMVNMGKITNAGINHIKPEESSLSGQMVKSNVADVLYYAENDFNFGTGSEGAPPRPPSKNDSGVGTTDFTYANRLTEEALVYLPYTQKLDFFEDEGWFNWTTEEWVKELSEPAKEILKNRMVAKGVGNEFYVEELDKNTIKMTKIGRQTYYRYHVNWGVLIFSLLVTTVALLITVIKIGRSVFDLAFHQIFGMFIAATDLTGGQRTKKVLVEIMNTFAVIFLMVFLLKLFILYSSWANGLKTEIGSIGVLLLLIAGAWALIDAPDIIQRMLGIDAGLRNGWQAAAGGYAAARTAGMAGKFAGKGLAGIGKGLGKSFGTGMNLGAKARGAVSKIGSKTSDGLSKESVKNMPGGPPDDDPPTPPGGGISPDDNPPFLPGEDGSLNSEDSQGYSTGGNTTIPSSDRDFQNNDTFSRLNSSVPPIPTNTEGGKGGSGGKSLPSKALNAKTKDGSIQGIKPMPTEQFARNNHGLTQSTTTSTPVPSSKGNTASQPMSGNHSSVQNKAVSTSGQQNVQQSHSPPIPSSKENAAGQPMSGNHSSIQNNGISTPGQRNVQESHSGPIPSSKGNMAKPMGANDNSVQTGTAPTSGQRDVQQSHSTPVPSSKENTASQPMSGNRSSMPTNRASTSVQRDVSKNHTYAPQTPASSQTTTHTTNTQSTSSSPSRKVHSTPNNSAAPENQTHVTQTTTFEDVVQSGQSSKIQNGQAARPSKTSTVHVNNHVQKLRQDIQNMTNDRNNGYNLEGSRPRRFNQNQSSNKKNVKGPKKYEE